MRLWDSASDLRPRGHTRVRQLGPNAVDSREVGLSTQPALGTDLLGQEGDLTCEFLQLVHHLVDGTLEVHDLGVHLFGMDEHFLAQVSHRDCGDNVTNLSQSLLEGKVGLLVLAQLPLKGANVLDAMLKSQALVAQLLVHLGAQIVNVLSLVLNLVGLLVEVVAEVVELLLGQGSSGGVLAIGDVSCCEPVRDLACC